MPYNREAGRVPVRLGRSVDALTRRRPIETHFARRRYVRVAVESTMYSDKPCTDTQAQYMTVCPQIYDMAENAVLLSSFYARRCSAWKRLSRHDSLFFDDRNQVVR